ncbi:hypothetical protein BpHYR1_043994 [Brachionus plicatilis]|uniref:Uncharacterized protein n=1 Tax=Brachionus plicatilis TaxID=10195 RepID=A0A3M7QTX6_BRAPC|nr:hypothetical protein BpHYR1_043994 [Brachionus plicatilis]
MQRHNLEHIIGAGAILNLAHVKFNLTCVACAKTVFRVVAMHYIQGLENAPFSRPWIECIATTRNTVLAHATQVKLNLTWARFSIAPAPMKCSRLWRCIIEQRNTELGIFIETQFG